MERLIKQADVLVENFHPGAIDHMGFTWEHIQELNPRLIFGSIKGFDEDSLMQMLKLMKTLPKPQVVPHQPQGFGTARH